MSYRWNAHETVASGAVSDSEATRPLQTGDDAPTLPFSAEAVADRAAEQAAKRPPTCPTAGWTTPTSRRASEIACTWQKSDTKRRNHASPICARP